MSGFPFTEDHDMIREAAHGFLQDWYNGGKGPQSVYDSGTGIDKALWNGLTQDLGMAGIAIDERFGGAGMGDLGLVVVLEELGRSMASAPFLSTGAIAVNVLNGMDTDAHNGRRQELLESIASGQTILSYFDGHDALMLKDGKISGTVRCVLDASHADRFLFSMRNGDALSVFDVASNEKGVTITSEKTLDPTRNFDTVTFENLSVGDIDIIGHITAENLNALHAKSYIALAAECVGGAQACLDMTLDYTAQRVQFGRPIASFQAVKHRCADMFILIESARNAVYAAAIAESDAKVEAGLIAKAYATDAYFKVAGDAVQMHGGIGFTWEYPLQWYFKRARANRAMFGASSQNYSRLADMIMGDAA